MTYELLVSGLSTFSIFLDHTVGHGTATEGETANKGLLLVFVLVAKDNYLSDIICDLEQMKTYSILPQFP